MKIPTEISSKEKKERKSTQIKIPSNTDFNRSSLICIIISNCRAADSNFLAEASNFGAKTSLHRPGAVLQERSELPFLNWRKQWPRLTPIHNFDWTTKKKHRLRHAFQRRHYRIEAFNYCRSRSQLVAWLKRRLELKGMWSGEIQWQEGIYWN